MILQRFYVQVVFRVILLSATALIFSWSWTNLHHLFTFITIGILFFIQVVLLIFFINRINRDLSRFLVSLKSGDLTTSFTTPAKKSIHEGLQKIVHEILQNIEKVKIEKESHYQYLQQVIEHVDVGLLSFDSKGKIDLINRAFLTMLKAPHIRYTRNLNAIHPEFEKTLSTIQSGQHRMMVVPVEENILHLVLRAKEFKLQNKNIKLVSVQNIQAELDEKELTSWQKLIRVLTHEIMNSVSPISSLATTLTRIFRKNSRTVEVTELSRNQVDDTARGLEIIGTRSKGLLEFVKQYRKINLLPKPVFERVPVLKILSHIQMMYTEDLIKKRISFQSKVFPEDLCLHADEQMIEQVLINLMNNAMFAIEETEKPFIKLKAFMNRDHQPILQITDNGSGIAEEIQESIFVPFFTTRKDGSGIGLSLARQIMHLHGGTITVQSSPEKETTFNLLFKQEAGIEK